MENIQEGTDKTAARLSDQISRVADALEKQNSLRRRLLTGLIFGVGTAIGASVIATLIIIGAARLLAPIGIDFLSELREARGVLETQIESQTPQQ
ncbi:hypothetical protein AMJ57_03320 [Parcubacteria bacterium SG8_24]|nr:MAG: hypothetical protein AMJ57_03320 [Parcubacteria bacterium SG8_24]